MYCPNCANEVKPDLRYCNSCGYRFEGESKADTGKIIANLSKTVGWIGVIGLIVFVFVMKLLLESDALQGAIIAIAFLYIAALFGICYTILDFIKSIYGGSKEKQKTQFQSPPEISGHDANQLEPARTAPASVVENTTRTLEKIPAESEK